MVIHGLQKMTLLDFPGVVACTVFLGGCDFRCPFCHNSELLDMSAPGVMDSDELLRFLGSRTGILDGVAITGGEPTLRKDLPELMEKIRSMGFKVKLDTAGYHPDMLKRVLDAGLADYVAMDIKNSKDRYAETVGLPIVDISKIEQSVELLKTSGVEYEFRTTVLRNFHDEASFKAIGEWIEGAEKYYLQGFVDRETVVYSGFTAYSRPEMERLLDIVKPYVKNAEIRGVD